eukprot:Sdes_comp15143_c0_seq1m3954
MEVPKILKDLAKYVVRAFYGPEYQVIIDILVRQNCIKEEAIIQLTKLDKKQVRHSLAVLRNDKLLKSESRQESKNQDERRTFPFMYWYIDFKVFVNVTKYRLHFLQKKLEQMLKREEDNQKYACGYCSSHYSLLDVGALLDPNDGSFKCSLCQGELHEYNNSEQVQDIQMKQGKLSQEIRTILSLLKESENISLLDSFSNPRSREANIHESNLEYYKGQRNHPGSKQKMGSLDSENVGIRIDFNEVQTKPNENIKEQPEWMTASTVTTNLSTDLRGEKNILVETDQISEVDGMDDQVYQEYLKTYYEQIKKQNESENTSQVGKRSAEEPEEDMVSKRIKKSDSDPHESLEASLVKDESIGEEMEDELESDSENVFVKVGDLMIPLANITEEHQKMMSEEEYSSYYELLTRTFGDQYY